MGDTLINVPTIVLSGLLGVVSYFLKRTIDVLDSVETKIQKMEIRIAVLLDRDRRKRISDYDKESDTHEQESDNY